MPKAKTVGDSVNFRFDYAAAAGSLSWGELHSTTMCVGTDASAGNCSEIWKSTYTYKFDNLFTDSPGNPTRPPGTGINPITSKTLTYQEKLTSGPAGSETPTDRSETTTYIVPTPVNAYRYPVTTSPVQNNGSGINQAQVTYPDGSYALTFTANLCPSTTDSRDLCVALPYRTQDRDGSVTEMGWVTNTAPPGLPANTIFNPYVKYIARKPTADATVYQITKVDLDQNGNTTSKTEYDWAGISAITYTNGTFIASACAACTAKRTTSSTYFANSTAYWESGASRFLRAVDTVTTGPAITSFVYDNAATTANVTQVKRLDSTTSTYVTSSATYSSNGNVESQTDARNNRTLTCYDANQLYPIVTAVGAQSGANCASNNPAVAPGGRKTAYTFDAGSGTLRSRTDSDNAITFSYEYDNLGRTTKGDNIHA